MWTSRKCISIFSGLLRRIVHILYKKNIANIWNCSYFLSDVWFFLVPQKKIAFFMKKANKNNEYACKCIMRIRIKNYITKAKFLQPEVSIKV
jgi:hypothetical protein